MTRHNTLLLSLLLILSVSLVGCEMSMDSPELDVNGMIKTLEDFGYEPYHSDEFKERVEEAVRDSRDNNIEIIEDNSQARRDFIFNDREELISLSRWDEADPSSASCVKQKNMSHEQYINYVLDKYVPQNYGLREVTEFTNDLEQISCYRENALNVKNAYDSYNFVFHPSENFVLSFQRMDNFTLDEEPKITEKQAEEIALEFLEAREPEFRGQISDIQLTVQTGNNFYDSDSKEDVKLTEDIYLMYQVTVGDKIVYVDAVCGEVVGGDEWAD